MRNPSAAADVIPPAYPHPSPHGNSPSAAGDCIFSPRKMRKGELVRDSTPVSTASYAANPLNFAPISGKADAMLSQITFGSTARRGTNAVSRAYVGVTSPK